MKEDLQQELTEVKAKNLLSLKTKEKKISVPNNYFSRKKIDLHSIADTEAIGKDYFEQKERSLKQIANQTKVVELQTKSIQNSTIKNQNWMMIAATLLIFLMAIPVVKKITTSNTSAYSLVDVNDRTFTDEELALLDGNIEDLIFDYFYNDNSSNDTNNTSLDTEYTELEELFTFEQL